MREETASQNNDMFQRQSVPWVVSAHRSIACLSFLSGHEVLMKEANSTMTSSKQQFHAAVLHMMKRRFHMGVSENRGP